MHVPIFISIWLENCVNVYISLINWEINLYIQTNIIEVTIESALENVSETS